MICIYCRTLESFEFFLILVKALSTILICYSIRTHPPNNGRRNDNSVQNKQSLDEKDILKCTRWKVVKMHLILYAEFFITVSLFFRAHIGHCYYQQGRMHNKFSFFFPFLFTGQKLSENHIQLILKFNLQLFNCWTSCWNEWMDSSWSVRTVLFSEHYNSERYIERRVRIFCRIIWSRKKAIYIQWAENMNYNILYI